MADDTKVKDSGSGKETAPSASWAHETLASATPFVAPAITALLLLGVFCLYYFVYVRARRDYLVNRNFRSLAVLGDQIQTNVANHANILRYFADQVSGSKRDKHERERADPIAEFHRLFASGNHESEKELWEDYMRFLAPDFHLTAIPSRGKGEGTLRVQRREGQWELMVVAPTERNQFTGTVNVEELLQPFVGSLPFEDVLLASENGSIIYQKAKTGPQFTRLEGLLESQVEEQTKNPKDDKSAQEGATARAPALPDKRDGTWTSPISWNSDKHWQKKSMHLTEVVIAGSRYKLFLQPVLIDIFGDDPRSSREKAQEWVLCGLASSAKLEWQSLAISSSFVIWVTAAFLIVLLSTPLLKVFFLNKREGFRLRECAMTGLCLVLLTSVITFAALQAVYFPSADPESSTQMEKLSVRLATSIHNELVQMRRQLTSFCDLDLLKQDLRHAEDREVYRFAFEGADNKFAFPRSTDYYPYLSNIFWTDDDGHQLVKWSAFKWATPMIDLAPFDFFKNLQSNLPDHAPLYLDGRQDLPFHFDSILAPNKVEYLAALNMKTCQCNPALCKDSGTKDAIREDIQKGWVFLVGRPFSLIEPVLPVSYGFALVDGAGKVLFHSDKTRNTRENFLEESDWNQELYSAMFGHSSGKALQIKYLGQDYLASVAPIPGLTNAPWSLIVYRDLTHIRTLNLQTMTMASTLFLVFLMGPIALIALLYVIHRPPYIAEYFWPHEGRLATYWYQTAMWAVLIALLAFLISGAPSDEIVASCAIILYSALVLTYWSFRLYPGAARAEGRKSSRSLLPALLTALFAVCVVWILYNQQSGLSRAFAIAPVAAICAIPLLAGPQMYLTGRLEGYAKRRAPWLLNRRVCYTISVLSLLLFIGVLTPLALFRASLRVERRLYAKRTQLHLASALQRRATLGASQCKANGLGPPDCAANEALKRVQCAAEALAVTDAKEGWSRKEMDVLCEGDINKWSFQDFTDTGEQLDGDSTYNEGWFHDLIYTLHHDYNRVAAETLAMLSDRPKTKEWSWSAGESSMTLHRRIPNIAIQSVLPAVGRGKRELALGSAIMLIVGSIFWALRKKLFLFDIVPLRSSQERTASHKLRSPYSGHIGESIWKECYPTPELQSIGEQLARDLGSESGPSEEYVVAEVLDRAEAYYGRLWSSCSEDQQFVLAQLAADGLPNPVNARPIRHLLHQGLIVRDPQFRIFNESFRRFLLTAASPKLKHQWQEESRKSGWGKTRGVFSTVMIVVAIFLLTTQNELWQSSATYVTTAIGAVGALLKLFNTVRGGSASGDKPS